MIISEVNNKVNYKMFANLSNEDLSEQINLIVGNNGVGKSKVLSDAAEFVKKESSVFFSFIDSGECYHVNDWQSYARIENCINNSEKRSALIKILSNAEDGFIDLFPEIYPEGGVMKAQVTWRREPILIKDLGRGFNQLLKLAVAILSDNQFVFIDDIEQGLHYSSFGNIIELIYNSASQQGTQFFISTQSAEFVRDLLTYKGGDCEYEVGRAIIKLGENAKYTNKGQLVASMIKNEEAVKLLDLGVELR